MAVIYKDEILLGHKQFSELRNYWKPQVYRLLVQMGKEELCGGWKPKI